MRSSLKIPRNISRTVRVSQIFSEYSSVIKRRSSRVASFSPAASASLCGFVPARLGMSSAEDAADAAELRRQLEAARLEIARERARNGDHAAEIKLLKQRHVEAHTAVEREEEALTNSLMKKLEKVNSEKREMLMRVEQEEEFLTNQLQKRLDRVVREKAELEAQCHALRRRQESVREESGAPSPLDARDAELRRLTREKVDLERQLEAEQECIMNKLHKQNAGLERERRTLRAECETLRKQVDELSTEKARLGREKVALENTMEAEEEHIVNRLQTQMLELFQRNQALQRRLEAASETPSVVSESDASEDERERLRDRAGGFGRHPHHHHPAAHPPWERDMYAAASAGRRRSQGSWSLSSAERVPAASSAQRRPTSGGPARGGGSGGGGGGDAGGGGAGHATGAANHGGGPKAMSVGGSSATTTPRSSVATTPLSTPRGGRKENAAKDARGEDKEKMIN